jgi:thiamine biosynthesis lipoprotein
VNDARRRRTLTCVLCWAVVAAAGCTRPRPADRLVGHTMGTTYEVVVVDRPRELAVAAIQAEVDGVLGDVERHLSGWTPDSELARFNAAAAADWIPASRLLAETVALAQAVSRNSGGAFDITVAPLVRAWGFGAGAASAPAAPAAAKLARLRQSVGYERLQLRPDPPALRKSVPTLQLDLDGIAPGLAVDRIAARLEARGVRDYLVELGGEVRARGRSSAGRPWRVAVEVPLPGERRPYALVELDGVGVSTSGDYRDFRSVAGRRISHTIDPRSGLPVAHGLASVTVVHASAAEADAWATALAVLGPQQGLALANQRGLAALFIERSAVGTLHESATAGFAAFRRPLARAL